MPVSRTPCLICTSTSKNMKYGFGENNSSPFYHCYLIRNVNLTVMLSLFRGSPHSLMPRTEPFPIFFFGGGGGIFTYFVCLQWVGPFKLQFTLFSFVTLFESNFDNKDDFDIYSSCKTPPNSRAITLLRRERQNLEFDQRKMWYLTRRDFD